MEGRICSSVLPSLFLVVASALFVARVQGESMAMDLLAA